MKDLTVGRPTKVILGFALSMFLGHLLGILYNFTDVIIVSKTINSDAFTGIALTSTATSLVFGLSNGMTAGFGIRIAQRFGAKDEEGLKNAIATAFILCLIIGLCLTAVAVPLAKPMLIAMKTPEKNFAYAYSYIVVMFGGITVSMFSGMMTGILRAVGDPKSPLIFSLISFAMNIGLDFLYIITFKMKYSGAGLATLTTQFITMSLAFIYINVRYPALRLKPRHFRWNTKCVKSHITAGLPMALQTSISSIGMMVQQTALNGLDGEIDGVVTAYVSAVKIDNISTGLINSLGSAIATFAGQNTGAGNETRVRQGLRAGLFLSACAVAVSFAVCIGLYKPLMSLFLTRGNGGDADLYYDEIMYLGRKYLLFQCCLYPLLGIVVSYRNTLQGMGYSFVAMFAGIMELAGRVLTSIVFVKLWSFTGICIANPAAWLFADIFFVTVYYILIIRRNKKTKPAVQS